MKQTLLLILAMLFGGVSLYAEESPRKEFLIEKNWKFIQGDFPEATKSDFNDQKWETVSIPHDWAIYGPFDRKYDLQNVAITQNNEKVSTVKTGRTGGLPYIGVGWYRNTFEIENFQGKNKKVSLLFDGAMSEARLCQRKRGNLLA